MTLKNFLKMAVLGIAFCSVFGMNNGIAAQNVQFQNILNELAIYHYEVLHNFPIMKMPSSFMASDPDLENLLKDELLEIIDIMKRTMNDNVNEQDLTKLVDNFKDLKNKSCHNTKYLFDVRKILHYSDQIIREVLNHMPAQHMV